ncbi:uncharacterized oxidoreductase [Chitinophaga sp. CF118]|uniref:SDR family oxidoreductase n=1 Tax=Chitinophaga sp. CF118 TaxID=1884367 RepID=UPI0008E9C452|nr:SDR family NAD(P)-dependent oxidoreductase [Chitinophaga sp. CF118]SFD76531.1 uncharacterized oxidoreductase [Chitinophaga sp. CF118]
MKTTNNTILITGGSAGIGFELAKSLSEKGNHVIITGRNADRLEKAAAKLQNVTSIVSDVTNEQDVDKLVSTLNTQFPKLNVVINNAGNAYLYKLTAGVNAVAKAKEEMQTNYFSVISLNEKLLPLLNKQNEAAIVNVSSIVAYAANHVLPGYSATKAALHSYTQSLRITLQDTNVKVFELMPPLVNTDFSAGIGGANGIPPQVVADEFLTSLEKDEYEIRVAGTADFYKFFLSAPQDALNMLNADK